MLHGAATETGLTPPTCLSMADLLYCDTKRMLMILNSSSVDFYSKIPKVAALELQLFVLHQEIWAGCTDMELNEWYMADHVWGKFLSIPPNTTLYSLQHKFSRSGMRYGARFVWPDVTLSGTVSLSCYSCVSHISQLRHKKVSSQTIFLFAVVWPLCELR